MEHYCDKCGTQTMLMSGKIYLQVHQEPYESGKEETARTGIDNIKRYIIAQFCEKCDEVATTHNE